MGALDNLYNGFLVFRAKHFLHKPELYQKLATGQSPKVLLIACSDSRVDPAILFDADPGELFMVRNVANLVPPYKPDSDHHGTSAAIEFAVCSLGVQAVVVLGHSHCGGINALRAVLAGEPVPGEFLKPWVSIAADAVEAHKHDEPGAEKAAIAKSVKNLYSFPWLKERAEKGQLEVSGWWFNFDDGVIEELDQKTGAFATKSLSLET